MSSNGNGKPRTLQRELPVKLSDAELIKIGKSLATLQKEIDGYRDKQRELAAKIRPLAKQVSAHVTSVDSGTELRMVRCEVHEGPGANIRIVRTDTGETIEDRAMTPAEAQGDRVQATEEASARGKAAAKKAGKGAEPKAKKGRKGGAGLRAVD